MLGDGQKFDQNQTLAYLQKASIVHAKAGSDMIAPSGMVDGMIKSIRHALDENGFNMMPIMSYWAFSDVFEEHCLDQTPYHGGWGLVK